MDMICDSLFRRLNVPGRRDRTESVVVDGIVCRYVTFLFGLVYFSLFFFTWYGNGGWGGLVWGVDVVALCFDCCVGSIPRNHIASPARIRLQNTFVRIFQTAFSKAYNTKALKNID